MSLETDLANWDMKSTNVIAGMYQQYCDDPEFQSRIVELAAGEFERGATWLLKRDLEVRKTLLATELADKIFTKASKTRHWEAKLHILQIMAWMPVSPTHLPAALDFVRGCMTSDRKFLRAWAYSGFYEIARQYPDYQVEAKQLFLHALDHEAAGSVLARVRRVAAQGF